jgi:hypothetical protein
MTDSTDEAMRRAREKRRPGWPLSVNHNRAGECLTAPRHSVSDPSQSSLSRPFGECRLSQGERR